MPDGTSIFLANRMRDLAWSCGFTALLLPPVAYSLALDEIDVRSRLGQPLDAVVDVSAAAGEVLETACFSVATDSGSGIPAVEGVHLHLDRARGRLTLRTSAPVREPLNEITVRVRCEGSPALDRSFLVALDPPDMRADSVYARAEPESNAPVVAPEAFVPAADVSDAPTRPVGAIERPLTRPAPPRPGPRRIPRPAPVARTDAIAQGSDYFVRIGDTLSDVAARVSGRPRGSVWAVAERIRARNPMAFLNGNPDQLMAGVTIAIPTLDGDLDLDAGLAQVPALPRPHQDPLQGVREYGYARPQRSFLLSTVLSADSLEKLQLRRLGFMQAAQAATARLAASRLETLGPKPEAPDRRDTETAVAATAAADDGDMAYAEDEAEDAQRTSAADDAAGATAALPGKAPARALASHPTVAPTAATADGAAAPRPSPTSWLLWALGAMLAGSALGGLLTRLFLRRRYQDELDRAQSQRRGSGLERTIRLDHGIIVDEHRHPGQPLMVDASTSEIAALRPAQPAPAAPVPAAASAEGPELRVQMRNELLDVVTEAPTDLTLKIESPIAALDLELPEMPELPGVPPPDATTVPTEVVAAHAAAAHDPLADSRQFAVDTDLLELAYTETDEDPDATTELPLDALEDLSLETLPELPAPEADEAAPASGDDDAFYHLEADPLDDTLLACERADESKVIALWNLEEPDEPATDAEASQAKAAKEG